MRIYHKFEKWVCDLGERLIDYKILFSEWNAIYKKESIYSNIKWTEQQQREFDNFWKEHFGKKYSNRWHKLYQSMNGIFCVKYFPELLYTTQLEKLWNPIQYCRVLCDKGLLKVLFDGIPIQDLRTPTEYVTCCNGIYRDNDCRIVSLKTIKDILWNIGRVCIKPTTETGSGKRVQFPIFENGKDSRNGCSIEYYLNNYGKNFTIQECIQEHQSLAQLHPSSLNTLRVITYCLDDQIFHAPLAARIGSGNSELDNIHAGGLSIGVHDDGQLCDDAIRLGYGNKNEHFEKHPDTGIVFAKYKIDGISKVLKAAEIAHARIPQLGIISWDFVVDSKGVPVLIEANLSNQSIWFPQIVNGKPAFGENTEKILEMIREHRK